MYKIAILGCENSHADGFLELIQKGLYPDLQVVGVYSNEEEPPKRLNAQFGVPIMKDFADLVGQVDGIMVTARHGDNHYKYAKPYLASGIPMFIDKPISCEEADAIRFMADAKACGVRLCGGSSYACLPNTTELSDVVAGRQLGAILGGHVVAPIYPNSPYAGFLFYAEHLIDIATRVFGYDIEAVNACRVGEHFACILKYKDFAITANYVSPQNAYYHISVYGELGAKKCELTYDEDHFTYELNHMVSLLRGEPMQKTYEEFIRPVFVMNAIMRSYTTQTWAEVNTYQIP